MATAEMTATFLVIVGAWYWTDRGSLTLAGSVVSGLLFGLACATRTSAFIVVPAIIAWGALYHRSFSRLMTNTLIACGVACVVFILGTATLYALFVRGTRLISGTLQHSSEKRPDLQRSAVLRRGWRIFLLLII